MNGSEFKAWRINEGLSQDQAAARLAISRSAVQTWERDGVPALQYGRRKDIFQSVARAKSPGRPSKLLDVPIRTREGKLLLTEAELANLSARWVLPEGSTTWHFSTLDRYGRGKTTWVRMRWPTGVDLTIADSPDLMDEDFIDALAACEAANATPKPLHPNYNAELARQTAELYEQSLENDD